MSRDNHGCILYRADRFYSVSPRKLLFEKLQKNKSESTIDTIYYLKCHL